MMSKSQMSGVEYRFYPIEEEVESCGVGGG